MLAIKGAAYGKPSSMAETAATNRFPLINLKKGATRGLEWMQIAQVGAINLKRFSLAVWLSAVRHLFVLTILSPANCKLQTRPPLPPEFPNIHCHIHIYPFFLNICHDNLLLNWTRTDCRLTCPRLYLAHFVGGCSPAHLSLCPALHKFDSFLHPCTCAANEVIQRLCHSRLEGPWSWAGMRQLATVGVAHLVATATCPKSASRSCVHYVATSLWHVCWHTLFEVGYNSFTISLFTLDIIKQRNCIIFCIKHVLMFRRSPFVLTLNPMIHYPLENMC